MSLSKATILAELQSDIRRMQGFKPAEMKTSDLGLEIMKGSFPDNSFPTACIHEFLSTHCEDTAATCGFMCSMLGLLMGNSGTAVWISSNRKLFPPALTSFGINPDRFVFIDLQKERHILWAMEEALKCGALSAVVGEVQRLDFTASRRLQLAVEESQVTGFVLRNHAAKLNPTACVSRWKVTSLPSVSINDLPGIGYPSWRVELLRMRNGKPGSWDLEWVNGKFMVVKEDVSLEQEQQLNVG